MKICSADNACFIAIEYQTDSGGYSGFQVAAHADIRHGKFDAKNDDVQLLNLEAFISELDQFILDRKRAPYLTGTYDTYFAFSARGTSVMLKYQLGDACCGRTTSYFLQSGEFEVEQEDLLQILGGFREFIKARQDASRNQSEETRF